MKLVCIDWSVVIATGMRPRMVVVVNGLFDSLLCLLKGVEGLIKPPFLFEDTIDPFSQCIFIRVAVLRHADATGVFF